MGPQNGAQLLVVRRRIVKICGYLCLWQPVNGGLAADMVDLFFPFSDHCGAANVGSIMRPPEAKSEMLP